MFEMMIIILELELLIVLLQPKFGGKIIDIVSGDISSPEKQIEARNAVKSTILTIFLVVIVG